MVVVIAATTGLAMVAGGTALHAGAGARVGSAAWNSVAPGRFVDLSFAGKPGDFYRANLRFNLHVNDVVVTVFNQSELQEWLERPGVPPEAGEGRPARVVVPGPYADPNFSDVVVEFFVHVPGTYHLIVWNNASQDSMRFRAWTGLVGKNYLKGWALAAAGVVVALSSAAAWAWHRHLWAASTFCACLAVKVGAFALGITRATTWASDLFPPAWEVYEDYKVYYIYWVDHVGRWSLLEAYSLPSYIYAPSFIATLFPFGRLVPGWWGLAIPLFAFNAATGLAAHDLARTAGLGERAPLAAMVACLLSPIDLLYSNYAWLNPSPFVFFCVLSTCFLARRWHVAAAFVAGVATTFKQFGATFLPLVVAAIVAWDAPPPRRLAKSLKVAGACAAFAGPVLLVSVPFLFHDPWTYFNQVLGRNTFFGATEYLDRDAYWFGSSINAVTPFKALGAPAPLTSGLAAVVASYVPLLVSVAAACSLVAFRGARDGRDLGRRIVLGAAALVLSLHLFYPRGSYKYYLLLLTPFASVAFQPSFWRGRGDGTSPTVLDAGVPLATGALVVVLWRAIYFFLVFGALVACVAKLSRRGASNVAGGEPRVARENS
ncbi:MAG: hypothetical protein Kow0069_23550 [Promethearchaeota archaeon]